MSYQELAKDIIDRLPDDKLVFVVNILENIGEMSGVDVLPEFTPNAETRAAIAEVDEMIRSGAGEHFGGSTADFFASLAED